MITKIDNRALVCDLVRWVAIESRPYSEVIDAWRTSCPRLTVWEDAVDAGLVNVSFDAASNMRIVTATKAGREFIGEVS